MTDISDQLLLYLGRFIPWEVNKQVSVLLLFIDMLSVILFKIKHPFVRQLLWHPDKFKCVQWINKIGYFLKNVQ